MKLLELNLIAFGPFSDCHIDLSGGEHGLHLIYGPNEAGKSSSLLAITYFLYGFPSQTSVDFKHPYKNLRIGGRLRHSDTSDLHVVRRKANQKSLRCSNDQQPVDDDALAPFLGDVDRGLFTTMFGINHERLRSGGQEIAQGNGRIGEMLFAAGAGVVDLQQLQTGLHCQMESLLKSTGRSGSIHSGIQEYLLQRKAVDEALISVEAWNRIEDDLRACRQTKRELDQRIGHLQRELERLQRIKLAGATIARWKSRRVNLAGLSDVPRLPPEFAQTANQLLTDLRMGQLQLSTATGDLERVAQQLDQLEVPEPVLQSAERIERLRDRIGAIRAALADRAAVETKREAFEREAKEILRELDRQPDLQAIDELRLPRDKSVKIQSLGNQLERLRERLQAERRNCDKLRREIASTQQILKTTPPAADVAELRAALRSVQQHGDVESELAASAMEAARLGTQIELAMKRLPLFEGALAQLEQLTVPSASTVDRFDAEFAASAQQLQALRRLLEEEQQEIERLQTRLSELESRQTIPTLAELEQSRRLRDQGWRLVRSAWNKPDSQAVGLTEFLQAFPTASCLADAYEQAVQAADALADALQQSADRVATKAKLQSDLQQCLTRQHRRKENLQLATTEQQALEQRWQLAWQPAGLKPLAPAEMQDWLRKSDALLLLAKQLRDQEHRQAQLQQQLDQSRNRLMDISQSLPHSTSLAKKNLLELMLHVQDKIDLEQSTASRRDQLTDRLSEYQAELVASEAEYARTESEVSAVQAQWASEMEHLGLEKSALPAQANSRLSSLQSLFDKFKDADRYRTRLEHIDRDAQQFAAEVEELVAQVAPELRQQPFDVAFQGLHGQLEAARLAASRRSTLIQQQQQAEAKRARALETTGQTQVKLDELMRQARVSCYDDLNPAAEKSRLRQDLERQVFELEDEIVGYAAGAGLEAFVADVERETEADQSLDVRIAASQQELQELGEARDAVIGQIRSAEIEQEKFDGSSLAAEKNAICESTISRLEDELHQLAVMRIAAAILKEGIERHRQKNQGPILGRASEIFRQITLGQFAGLQAEFNDKGEPVLAGIRGEAAVSHPPLADDSLSDESPDLPTLFDFDDGSQVEAAAVNPSGQRVLVDGMSDGTCDQLYLSLRLASLESWLVHHEPLPFIVDDVLMNFDDARAVATLKILAQLSRRTQVIFFTHHQHLVDLAREHLSPEDLCITTIRPRSPTLA